ncbi:MAG: outer membrane lipid asymmetry maintenance protein MlaD [Desulfobacterales bacterium]|jgi:phospholipid/cholesterol/gamma-HCH transport system substrate-binding protein|nr:outer membrane lipid asymmetry maintenance protein MlaD [Desulfobacterales bacterium]
MRQSSVEMGVGVFVLLGIICVGYLTFRLGEVEILGDKYYPLNARFTSVTGLKVGAQVEIAGVQVGQVDAIVLDRKDLVAMVRLKIKEGLNLSDDVIASVKSAGLLGDKYIQLSPGGSDRILKPGEMIIETEPALDIEALISKYAFGKLDKTEKPD